MSVEIEHIEEGKNGSPVPKRKKFWLFRALTWFNKAVWRVLFFLSVALFCLWMALHSPYIQNQALQKFLHSLSEDMGSTIQIDSAYVNFFDRLHIRGIYIQDQSCDTLLYVGSLNASLRVNIFSILKNKYDLENIALNDVVVNIKKNVRQPKTNLDFLLAYLQPKSKKENKQPFSLALEAIYLNRVRFSYQDEFKGEKHRATLPCAIVKVKKMDFKTNHFSLNDVELSNIDYALEKFEGKAKPSTDSLIALTDSISKNPFVLDIAHVSLQNSRFQLDDWTQAAKNLPPHAVNYKHIKTSNLNLTAENSTYSDWIYTGNILNLSGNEQSGFVLKKLAANARIGYDGIELNQLVLQTPNSDLGDTLTFNINSYQDFKDFNNEVTMRAQFKKNSRIAIQDILHFVPSLEKNRFIAQNKGEVLRMEGEIAGKVNRLRGNNLTLQLADGTLLMGDFRSRDLAVRQEEFLDLKLTRLKTSMRTLRLLIPNFNAPENFDKLTSLDFSGKFFGFFNSFVADGVLRTNLGNVESDIQLDLKAGKEKAQYQGSINLLNFDLAAWTGDANFGKVSFKAKVEEGIGITAQHIKAKVKANVESLYYKNYHYQNLFIDGTFNKKFFDGNFSIKDDNLHLAFDGSVDFNDSIPVFDFKAKIHQLDLKKLKLADRDFQMTGDVKFKFKGLKLSDIQGESAVYKFALREGKAHYTVDSLSVSSFKKEGGTRQMDISSNIFQASLNGQFDLAEIPDDWLQYVEKYYPAFAQKWNIKSKKTPLIKQKSYFFKAKIHDTQNWTSLVDANLDTLKKVFIKGHFDSQRDSFDLEAEVPKIKYGNVELKDIVLLSHGTRDHSTFDIGVFNTAIGSQMQIPVTAFYGNVQRDTILFNLNTTNFSSVLDNINLNGKFFLADKFMQVIFLPSDLAIYNQKWKISSDNFLRFGKDYLETRNFKLTNADKLILLQSIDNKGIQLNMDNLSIAFVNDFLKYPPLQFDGNLRLAVQSKNIFKLQDLNTTLEIDTFWVNKDDWGVFKLTAKTNDLKTPIEANIYIDKGESQWRVEGQYIPSYIKNNPLANSFDFDINIKKHPLKVAEYFIRTGIKNTTGFFDSHLQLKGKPSRPDIAGDITVYDAALTLDYLKTRYTIKRETAKVNNYLFDVTGAKIYDRLNNVATMSGGITHDHLRNFGLNVTLNTDKFLALETKKEHNPLYYGTAIGSANVRFTGTFTQTDIYVNATSQTGTALAIPINTSRDGKEVKFIKFRNPTTDNANAIKNTTLRGLTLKMDLNVTPDSEIRLIFDEKAGDEIKGRGRGDLEIDISRTGEFKMNGNYVVQSGSYLFTLPIITDVISVNKPFSVKEGGTITWNGSPFDAEIKLEAMYDRNAPLYPLISEYVEGDEDLANQAKSATKVDLTLLLTGQLLKPDINFKLNFPAIKGKLKTIVDTKLRAADDDKNELNRQVALLILTGQFISSYNSTLTGGQGLTDVSINTLSEFVSTQLSGYLTNLLSEVIPDLDLNVNYRQFSESIGNINRVGREIELSLTKRFLNDRLRINLSDNFNIDQSTASGAYYGPEFSLEYYITADGRLRFRLFKNNEQLVSGTQIKWGLGITYSIEFDSFKKRKKQPKRYDSLPEFFENMKQDAKKQSEDLQ